MRNVHIFFLILTFCRPRFTSAEVNPDETGKTNDVDEVNESNDPANRMGPETSGRDDEIEVSNRIQDEIDDDPPGRPSRRILDEFQSDLAAIQNLAREVGPVTVNVRRSMQSRRSVDFKARIFKTFVGNILMNCIASLEERVPALKPITKHLRKIVVAMLLL